MGKPETIDQLMDAWWFEGCSYIPEEDAFTGGRCKKVLEGAEEEELHFDHGYNYKGELTEGKVEYNLNKFKENPDQYIDDQIEGLTTIQETFTGELDILNHKIHKNNKFYSKMETALQFVPMNLDIYKKIARKALSAFYLLTDFKTLKKLIQDHIKREQRELDGRIRYKRAIDFGEVFFQSIIDHHSDYLSAEGAKKMPKLLELTKEASRIYGDIVNCQRGIVEQYERELYTWYPEEKKPLQQQNQNT